MDVDMIMYKRPSQKSLEFTDIGAAFSPPWHLTRDIFIEREGEFVFELRFLTLILYQV